MFDQVVVGVRDDDEAARDAIALAKALLSPQGQLTLVHVHVLRPRPARDSGAVGDAAKCRYAEERLAALSGALEVSGGAVCVEARSAGRGLHEFAARVGADLLVVSASAKDELARTFIGDDTRGALEGAPCAVAVAPVGYHAHTGAMRRIGVAYDESPASQRALRVARSLAGDYQAELTAIEAVAAPLYAEDPWGVEAEIEERLAMARERLAALEDVKPEVTFGDAVDELSRHGESVDLLVLGSDRRRLTDRLFEGSIAERLADRAASPLLVLPVPQG